MQQLTQKLSNGETKVQDVPNPILGKGMILVKNHYSLISAGTEGNTAKTARKSLIGKAKERPQQVKQVLDVLKKQGPIQTYRAVTKKLEAYSPAGYSCSGEVIEVGEGVTEFAVGDRVACAGVGFANHAELVTVPVNLSVKLDPKSNLQNASYNTLGAIALQGVRQADLSLGETCAVIGLGLLGQLASLMLRASGVRVIGIDVSDAAVAQAKEHCADIALSRSTAGIEDIILNYTNGLGVDSVIIAAATSSLDPINFAGAICRKKASIIILGAVPTGFDREPYFYKKELEVKMSCSYGPGRYDLNYEEKGQDYPAAYVRWTQKRNMEAFQELIANKKINLDYLTTHQFNFNDAANAYDLVVNRTEPFLGIALKYDISKEHSDSDKVTISELNTQSQINIGFIGAGSYAQGNLLPNIPQKDEDITLKGVLTNSGTTSKRVAERFKFEYCTSSEEDIYNKDINTIFVATRHDSHAKYVLKALQNKCHVFVEKPICLIESELDEIRSAYNTQQGKCQVMIGFNRRFAPLSQKLRKKIASGPMSMIYRVNAGDIPAGTWIQDIEIGGGRVIGEACHFIDYLTWLNGSLPVRVYASALPDPNGHNDTLNINLEFENGSTGVIAYYANGSKELSKEYIEVYKSGITAIITDFKELKIYGKGKTYKKKLINQDKGQAFMVESFIKSIKESGIPTIEFNEIDRVTQASFAVLESIQSKNVVQL